MWQELQPGDPQVIGPYRIRGQLGVGGMGRVFLGLSEGGRPVAVKVVRADLAADPEFRTRFRREITVARKVSSQFTAPVIDADVDGAAPWLATAFVAGPSLADAVSQHGPLPVRAVLELAAGLAEGLRAIHAAGIVHRDLKPSNVLLAPDGPRVIDFGISRAVEASALTHTGMVVGSPGFMSPGAGRGRRGRTAYRHLQPGRGPRLRRHGRRAVRHRVHAGAGLPRGPQPGKPGSRASRGSPADRPVPGQGSRPAAHRARAPGRDGDGRARRGLAPRTADADVPAVFRGCSAGRRPAPRRGTRAFLTARSPPSPARRAPSPCRHVPPPPGPASGERRRESGRPRRGLRRPLAIAAIVAGLVAGSTAGGMALAASLAASPGAHAGQQATSEQSDSPATFQPPTSVRAAGGLPEHVPARRGSEHHRARDAAEHAPAARLGEHAHRALVACAEHVRPAAPAPTPSTSYLQGTGGY